jgi:hypothetical protein
MIDEDPLERYNRPIVGINVHEMVPPYDVIPSPYRAEFGEGKMWVEVADQLFFRGNGQHVSYSMQEGINSQLAFGNLRIILSSFELKHEHKIAAAAYLMSRWFERFEILEG